MTLTVDLRYWHVRGSSPRMMHGSCLCWRAQQRKASWRESWPVSLSGCGRTEVFKPASAAPVNISSTTRQHSESHTRTHTRKQTRQQNLSQPLKRLNGPSHTNLCQEFLMAECSTLDDQTPKLLPVHCKHTETTCQAQVVPAFSYAQRAESYSTMYLSGLLHCQYLPSSTGPEEQRLERLFNLWPYASAKGTFATRLKNKCRVKLNCLILFLDQPEAFIYCARVHRVETNDIITRQLLCFVGRKNICLVLLLQSRNQRLRCRARELQLLAIF